MKPREKEVRYYEVDAVGYVIARAEFPPNDAFYQLRR